MTNANPVESRLLRQDHPQSMRSLVRMFGLPGLWSAVGELAAAVKTGEPSGGYLSQHPDASRIFGEAMAAKAHGAIAGILRLTIFPALASRTGSEAAVDRIAAP